MGRFICNLPQIRQNEDEALVQEMAMFQSFVVGMAIVRRLGGNKLAANSRFLCLCDVVDDITDALHAFDAFQNSDEISCKLAAETSDFVESIGKSFSISCREPSSDKEQDEGCLFSKLLFFLFTTEDFPTGSDSHPMGYVIALQRGAGGSPW